MDTDTHEQIRALRRLGWTLSRIQEATGIRRETVSGYLKAAGIAVRGRSRRSESKAKRPFSEGVSTDLEAKPAITSDGVSTDPVRALSPGRAPTASACEPYREIIGDALAGGRNAVAICRTLVDDHGFPARYPRVAS